MTETAFMKELRVRHRLKEGAPFEPSDDRPDGYGPTGKPYVVLQGIGGEAEAAEAFARYRHGRPGTLYWRTVPEFRHFKGAGEAFYMRLLID